MVDSLTQRKFRWYSPTDTAAERKLLLKLDFLLVGYAFVVFWVKYIDQTNINNAYVSGLSEEFNFHGNQLVQFQTMFVIANVIGLIPMAYLFPTIPLFWLVPGLEFGWGVFTLLQFHAKGDSEFMAYRFIIGLFEAPYYSCVHFALGSWYRSDELARRGGIFQAAINLGTLTAGLLQSASSKNLSGVNVLSGWRWNFIITAIIPLTLAPIGFFIWPGTPDKPNRRVISEADIAVAKARLKSAGVQVEPVPFSIPLLKHAFSHKKIYILVGWLTIVFNCSFANGAFLLWVKSLKRFSIPKINNLGTIPSVVSIFVTPTTSFAADLAVGRTAAFVFIAALNFTALVIMAVYEVPEAAKWFSLSLSAMTNALIPLIYSWANTLMRHDAKERAITLALMQIVATSTNAWVPLLVWPTVESPKFRKGYPYAAVMTFVAIIVALCVRYIYRKEEAELDNQRSDQSQEVQALDEHGGESPVPESIEDGKHKTIDVKETSM